MELERERGAKRSSVLCRLWLLSERRAAKLRLSGAEWVRVIFKARHERSRRLASLAKCGR